MKFPDSVIPKMSQETNKNHSVIEDYEIYYHSVQQKISEISQKKKNGEITMDELISQTKILDKTVDYKELSRFKQQELINMFRFDGDENYRSKIVEEIKDQESIAIGGSNHKGVFAISENRIVKMLNSTNYPYELPMVKLTQEMEADNLVKTYDVFEHDNLLYVVQDKAIGKEMQAYSQEEVDAIPQEHYDALVQLVNKYASHGIATDPSKISNLFYDPQKGFTVIDLGAVTYQRSLDYHIAGYFTKSLSQEKINRAIAKFGEYQLIPILPTLENKLKTLSHEANKPLAK